MSTRDTSESLWFEDELVASKKEAIEITYPKAKLYTGLMPLNTEIDAGAEQYRYFQFSSQGMAKIVANYATDFPTISLSGEEFYTPIRSIGDAFIMNKQEMRAEMMAPKGVVRRKAAAAKEVIDMKIEDILLKARTGNKDYAGLTGLLYAANVTKGTVATRNGHITFASKVAASAPDEVLKDLIDANNAIVTLTVGNEQPNTLLLPIAQYGLIMSTKMSVYDQTTIAQAFLNACPNITKIEWVAGLASVNPVPSTLAASATDCMVFYDRNPAKLEGLIPVAFETNEPEREGLTLKTLCDARCGGVVVYKPLSISIVEGI